MIKYTEKIKQAILGRFLGKVSDDRIRVEAVSRSGGNFSTVITSATPTMRVETFATWKRALILALDPMNPDRSLLTDNYNSLLLDCHLSACIDTRILKIQRSKFKITNTKTGEENEELTNLLVREWFADFIEMALMAEFVGCSLIELTELNDVLEVDKITKIPNSNFNPQKGLILKAPGDTSGWAYKEGILSDYYVQVGSDAELGVLQNMGPIVIAKKVAIGSWLDFIEKFGVPPRWVITDTVDKTRISELDKMMKQMLTGSYSVLAGNERIEFANIPSTNADAVFNLLIDRCNSEISKRILGATGTMDEKSFVGAALVHQSMAFERHAADKARIANITNKLLIPRLIKISSAYAKLSGHTFAFDETFEMEPSVLVDKAVALSQYYDLDFEYISRRTGIPITGIRQAESNSSDGTQGGVPEKKKLRDRLSSLFVAINAFYENVHTCGTDSHDINAIDISEWRKVYIEMAKQVYYGKLDKSDINEDAVRLTYQELKEGAETGYGKGWNKQKNYLQVKEMQKNLYKFSCAKDRVMAERINQLLVHNGRIRDFGSFITLVEKENVKYNFQYLKTEYKTAVQAAAMAKQWEEYQRNKKNYPNLIYKTQADQKVRDTHQALHDVIVPVDDVFWTKYYPPNGWNCRCYVEQTDQPATETPEKIKNVPEEFENNIGVSGQIYKEDGKPHPYFALLNSDDDYKKSFEFAKMYNPAYNKIESYTNGSTVFDSVFSDKADFEANLSSAKILANNHKDTIIKIRPHLDGNILKDWTNPEYEINGFLADRHEGSVFNAIDNKPKQIKNFIKKYNEQFPNAKIAEQYSIYIDTSKLNYTIDDIVSVQEGKKQSVLDKINGFLHKSNNIQSVFIENKGKVIEIKRGATKNEIEKLLYTIYKK